MPEKTQTHGGMDVRLGAERFYSELDWLKSWHSFSFGAHYDPANLHHGLLRVFNEDIIAPGGGFPTHPHQNMEIVTWVLSGRLEHQDSEGHQGVIVPGLAQRMSAGAGIAHSEMNAGAEPVHVVQMWVLPDQENGEPGYAQRDLTAELDRGAWVAVASGQGHETAIPIHQKHAVLWVARLQKGDRVDVPDAAFGHLFVARGGARLAESRELTQGDAVRLRSGGSLALEATWPGTEAMYWAMDRSA